MNLQDITHETSWYDILPHLTKACNRILVVGPPSTGKSTTIMQATGTEYRVTMHARVSVEELIGCKDLQEGNIVWIDGPVVRAMREGKSLLIDEIDKLGPDVEGMVYGFADDKPHVVLPNGEIVYAAPGYKVLMTSNEPPSSLPQPIRDRIECILYADIPHPDAFPAEATLAERELSLRWYKRIPRPSIVVEPTPRKIRVFHKLLAANIPPLVAARSVYCDSTSEYASALANIESTLEQL